MPLPKIATPTYELELPSTGKTVKFRPFLVKEEKLLVLALESDDAKEITINRNGHILRLVFPEVNRFFYNSYSVAKIEAPSHNQVRTYEAWKQ